MNYEQALVKSYARFKKSIGADILNANCNSKKSFDLQYMLDGKTWCFEAKSHMSGDAYNGVHKLFGELLKDASRILKCKNKRMKLGLLLDARHSDRVKSKGLDFYSMKFSEIDLDLLMNFGKIVRLERVVFFNPKTKNSQEFSWKNFLKEIQ